MLAFVLGQWEILALIVLAIVLFGSARLPMVGRSIGSAIVQFRKAIKGDEEPSELTDSTKPASGRDPRSD